MFILWIFLIYLAIGVAWTLLERVFYGKVKSALLHDIIAIALAISLYFNFS